MSEDTSVSGSFRVDAPGAFDFDVLAVKWDMDNIHWTLEPNGSELLLSQSEYVVGSNDHFQEGLQTVLDDLQDAGCNVNGSVYFQGEEPFHGAAGRITIEDNNLDIEHWGTVYELFEGHAARLLAEY